MFAVLLSLVLILAAVFYFLLTKNKNYWKQRRVAGPESHFLAGTYPKSSSNLPGYNFLTEADEIFMKYCKGHRYVGTFEHLKPVLMITDPALAKDIFVNYFKNFEYNTYAEEVHAKVDPLFGRNAFFLKGEAWKVSRSETSPAFTMLKLKPMFPIVSEVTKRMIEYIDDNGNNGENGIQIKEISRRFTGDVVCNCMFGIDSKAFESLDFFIKPADDVLEPDGKYKCIRKIIDIFPNLQKFIKIPFTNSKFNSWFIELTKQAIELRKQSGIQRDDYLNFVLDLQVKKGLSLEDVAGHLFTLFLDGYETTSHFLAGGLNLISKNVDVQQKLREEISSHKYIDYETLNQLPYLDSVFHETLRVTPFPFPLRKRCTESLEITDYDGKVLKIEKGVDVFLPVWSLQRHPNIYTQTDEFNPDRFDEANGGTKRFKDLGALMPFGNGPRICIGMRFAAIQIKAALVEIIRNYEIIEKESTKVQATNGIFFTDNVTVVGFKRL